MRCGSCGAEMTAGKRFCTQCGAAVAEALAPEDEAFGDGPPPAEPATRRLRRFLIAALCLAAVAVLGGCIVLGWLLNDWVSDPEPVSVTVTRPVTVIEEDRQQAESMPSVVGLDEATARQVLLDAGIDLERVSTEDQPYAGAPGLVVDQTPTAGSELASEDISLRISEEATTPSLVNENLEEARALLAELGASVLVESRYEPGAEEGMVLETDPAAGAALSDRVTLVVADPPSSVFLSELEAIESDCGAETLSIAGRQWENALLCEPFDEDDDAVMEYVLNRRVASFAVVLGLGDRGARDTPATFRVIVDGQPRLTRTVPFGRAVRIQVPVVGALRIRLEVGIPRSSPSDQNVGAAWADARFLGGRDAIDDLAAESSL